jgi:hypothetical protein
MGAHSSYTAEMADAIVEWIAQGKTLREFCRQPNTPCWSTVYNWREEHPDFDTRFARAREMGGDAIGEETLSIADTPVEGETTTIEGDGDGDGDGDGKKVTTRREDMLGHRKLQVETRLKLLAKWFPKKYGESATLALTGPNGGPLQSVTITTDDPVEAARAYQELIKG